MTELQGSLDSRPLPAVFLFLQDASKTGKLRLERDGVTRSFFIRNGAIIAAESSVRTDSLEWLFFRAGILSEERHGRVKAQIDEGAHSGVALIETGGLTPEILCEWIGNRVGFLTGEALSWEDGNFFFEEEAAPPEGTILVETFPRQIILDILRKKGTVATGSSPPSGDTIPYPLLGTGIIVSLENHESYVLSLVNGRRSVAEICRISGFGQAHTLQMICLLSTAGLLSREGVAAVETATMAADNQAQGSTDCLMPEHLGLPEGDAPTEIREIVRVYNDLYVRIATTMVKEIGPIAEQLLEKTLQETRANHTTLFHRINGTREGALPEETVIRNLNLIRDAEPREALLRGLGEHLTGMLMAVRRILGPDHETRLTGQLKELRWTST